MNARRPTLTLVAQGAFAGRFRMAVITVVETVIDRRFQCVSKLGSPVGLLMTTTKSLVLRFSLVCRHCDW